MKKLTDTIITITFYTVLSLYSATTIAEEIVETTRNQVDTLIDAAKQLPQGDPKKETLYKEALALSPSNAQALFNLALLLQTKNEFDEASQLYRKLLTLNPADALAHYNLANVLLALDDPTLWQQSAWHLRQFMYYGDSSADDNKARTALEKLEENLSILHQPYIQPSYTQEQLTMILTRVSPSDSVRGSSRYDGPRLPLMLNFAPQSAELTPTAKKQLDNLATVLKIAALSHDRIQIEGYTDTHEHPEFAQRTQYAKQRAERVSQYLQQAHQLPSQRFTIKAFADLEIISANNTPEGRAANRRVELYNLGKGSKITAPLHQ